MNQGIYKLVYSKVLNMFVPVSEAARGSGYKNAKRIRKHSKNAFVYTLMLSFTYTGQVCADALPAGLNIKNIVSGTEIAGATANSINFRQLAPKAIVDWNTLNLQQGHNFNVDMQRSWSMLNRIHDLGPSVLNGNVNAAGNIYFINTNGIIFGPNAQFNVGSLYAGTLDITDTLFNDGFISDQPLEFKPVFELVGALGKSVEVQAGAVINTSQGGKVLLFSENVKNSGIINTPDGQTILAAGKKVYLADAQNPANPENPVGFLVEVDAGGTATNLGEIIAKRGNITIAGLAVNQKGTLTATTSVRANGSIYLQAQDRVADGGQSGTRDGAVTLAKGSVTEVKPEPNDPEEITRQQAFIYAEDNDSGKLKKSEVKIEARSINIDGTISAKGGTVKAINRDELENSSIYLGSNAVIDVSGVDATAPMSRNQISPELFSGELGDAPVLRGGPIFRQKVFVDLRKGANGLFDTTPFEKQQKVTIDEALTKGGTIKLSTAGDLVINKGATLDVSGGLTTYLAGEIKETNLSFNGVLVPISEAKSGVAYDKTAEFYMVKDTKTGSDAYQLWDLSGGGTAGWGNIGNGNLTSNQIKTTTVGSFEDSYFNGDDAGKLDLASSNPDVITKNLVLAGTILANTKVSTQQLIAQKIPKGGELLASANQLTIAKVAKEVTTNFGDFLDPNNYESVINTDFLANGFNRVDLSNTGKVVVNEVLVVEPNGYVALSKASNQINADIIAPGSNVTAASNANTAIADGVSISTAGLFTNDKQGVPNRFISESVVNAGNIDIGFVNLGKNVILDASAGAHVDSKGKLEEGVAGDIRFTSTAGAVDESVVLQSYGFKKGGALTVSFADTSNTPFKLNIAGNPNASSTDIDIANNQFSQGGFSKFNFSATDINIGDTAGAPQEILGNTQVWQLNEGFANQTGGQTMAQVATPYSQPDSIRAPVSLSFSANKPDGTVTLAENTTIRTSGVGGNVSLSASKQLNVLGDIVTPSGSIDIKLTDTDGSLPYDATQAIFIGENSSLSAVGTTLTLPDSRPKVLKTQVFNAGTINIDAPKGVVVVKNGAVMDVSGAAIMNDVQTPTGFVRQTLYGDAGIIKIGARDGLKLDGTFKGLATGTGRNGTLDVGFTNTPVLSLQVPVPSGNREFTITQQKQLVANNVLSGDALKTDTGEVFIENSTDIMRGQISVQQINEGGFANLNVKSYEPNTAPGATSSVQLQDGLNLTIAGNLKIDTPLINVQDDANIVGGGNANLSAGHVTFKTPNLTIDKSSVTAGGGKFVVNSKQLYLDGAGGTNGAGQVGIAGVNKTEINTALDIHGQGGIVANGDVTLTARQIYPNTKGEGVKNSLSFEAIGENSKITVNTNGAKAKPVLSAVGTLNLKADDIVQNGVLSAPFGTINLEGKNSVTLTEGSITSISADKQTIPYLQTQLIGRETAPPGQTLPEKSISIKSAKVDVKKNAVLDLSSSGELFATEFVPGAGGSKNVFTNPNTYAVLPSIGQEYSPSGDASGGVGESVFLTGVDGLATGNYTLLPASYALVPGAFMVEISPAGNKVLPTESIKQLDGTSLTSGYRTDLATGSRDANWSTFKVTNGAVFRPAQGEISRAPSQFQLTNLTDFFSNPINTGGLDVPLPIDVGRLSLAASSTLVLDGQVIANKGQDSKGNFGDGLQADISAEKIRVVSSIGAEDGSLQLTANSINALKAESVLLGGSVTLENSVNKITAVAQTVSIENNSANAINTPELIVTALDTLTVKAGAVVDTGAAASKPTQKTIEITGNGALLALSSKNDISYSRVGGSAAAINGVLNVEAGSILKAGNSLVVDATKSTTLASRPILQDGGTAYFGSNSILLGNAPTNTVGLSLNAAAFDALGQLKSLTLSSYNNVDTFGAFNLGNTILDLTINAAGIAGHLDSSDAAATPSIITAKKFTLKNTTDATFTNPVDPSGRDLQINATTVKFEGKDATSAASNSGKTQIAGFNNLNITADEVHVAQTGSVNLNVAKTTINTGRVTGETGAYIKDNAGILVKDTTTNFKIEGQDLTVAKLATAQLSANKEFGAKLDIAANNLTVASDIDLASGQLTLTSANNLNIENGANLTAKSSNKDFYNITKDAPAGTVTLASTNGNVNVNTGAVVDVTSQGEANAGLVKVVATNGTANIAGDLRGVATGSGKGGVLDMDVKTLADLSVTNSKAVGFSEGRQYRVRTGDVAITGAGTNALAARETIVSADAGKITVSGDIIATAPKNSRIGLYAGNGVTLESSANLAAKSTKAGEEGGKVDIETTAEPLDFKMGSKVDTSAGTGGKDGKVYLGVARTADNLDINVANMDTTFIGTRKIDIGGLDSVETNTVNSANQAAAFDKAEEFMQSVIADGTKGLQRLALAGDSRIAIVPVVEFKNTNENVSKGNLTLADTFDLHTWRFDPVTGQRVTDVDQLFSGKNAEGKTLLAGVLNLRAKGDVLINATLSDGFSSATLGEKTSPAVPEVVGVPAVYDIDGNEITPEVEAAAAIPATGVQGIESWSNNIAAGADFSAANPLTTQKIATLDPSISAAKAIATIATIAIANIPNSQVKLVSGFPGYKLADAPIVAIKVNTIPTTTNASAGSSTRLNVANTGEKELVKSNGAAVKKSDLAVGVTYLAKYDAASGKYKLIDDTPDVMLANNIGIRTGTGAINIAAAGDLVMIKDANTNPSLRKSDAVIYTAGRVAEQLDGFVAPSKTSNISPLYLTDGGDISIQTKGNIVGGEPLSGRQLINNFLYRGGELDIQDTTWWVQPENFKQSLATLGGGDVKIMAGGSASNFSALLPTNARFDIDLSTGKPKIKQAINGGGDLTLDVAGNLNNGVYLVAKGQGDIKVGGSIQQPSNTFGTVLALQDGTFNVYTKKDNYIEAVINPTLFSSSILNGSNITSANFNTYSDAASVNLTSLLANVTLGNRALRGTNAASGLNNNGTADGYLPSKFSAVAFNGDIATGRESTLIPSATGDLTLLAANNITFNANFNMSDADPALFANVENPDSATQITSHANPLLHKNDTKPVLIVAKTGDIVGGTNIAVTTPKFTKALAGGDIKNITLNIQNNNASDVSLIKASRDIESINASIAGPGEMLVQAARNIDLSKEANTITAIGKKNNLALPSDGASITLQAGLGNGDTLPQVQAYIDQYILPAGAGPAGLVGDTDKSVADKLVDYRAATARTLTDFMRKKTGNSNLDDTQALALFNTLDIESKTIFANRHLNSELVASAEDFKTTASDGRGFAAIAKLFPNKNPGDILMFKTKVATNSGGSIDFVAPNGEIVVGTTGAVTGDIGVLTQAGGNIRMFADGDIQVNNSKIITQAGGDIILYSDNGDIDAGKGSKAATSSPETTVSTDKDGNTTVEVIASSAGSGIRTDTSDPDGPNGPKKAPVRGDVKLITPRGTVNASEGGIASNNLFIRAVAVLNAENIQVQGVSSGTPLAATSNLAGVSVSSPTDAVNSATAAVAESVAQSAAQTLVKPTLPSIISVDVISIGD